MYQPGDWIDYTCRLFGHWIKNAVILKGPIKDHKNNNDLPYHYDGDYYLLHKWQRNRFTKSGFYEFTVRADRIRFAVKS